MNEDLKKLLAILFGVDAETATDESLLEAGKTFAEKLAAKKEAPSENPPDVAALSADVMAIKGQIEADARDRVLADAMRDGKLVPQSVRDLPLDAMRKVVADLPKDVVPLSARTPEGIKSLGTLDALSATDKQVAAQLGITAEDWRK